MPKDLAARVCWLDFLNYGSDPFLKSLQSEGFNCLEDCGDLQIWQIEIYSNVVIEILKVNSIPCEPVSRIPGISANRIDQDRRLLCVPHGMDPYYRLMIYEYSKMEKNQFKDLTSVLKLLKNVIVKLKVSYLWQSYN